MGGTQSWIALALAALTALGAPIATAISYGPQITGLRDQIVDVKQDVRELRGDIKKLIEKR